MSSELSDYRYRGAAALVLLHETHLREFVAIWRDAKSLGLHLPETADPDYASLETLLRHVLGCARGYMVWCCEKLTLGDPGIDPVPETGQIDESADQYVEHVLERWRRPLSGVSEKECNMVYDSRWGVGYCVDAMLEHAVMHPIRHSFQLEELMLKAGREKGSHRVR